MPPSTQIVRNEEPFHGLPTYPDNVKDLTAIVTGANGMSGYHMVRVLAAAPQRWRKIYCLSRRPPPDNFFEDLGEGAQRVEHISVDFLAAPAKIAEALKGKVDKVDHVFFFSYMQPQQTGDILNMWSDAEELATINGNLMRNFLGGLAGAGLTPKRFLLQTGAKHYGFHIGPATNPSFEEDPRIYLEANFYYPQEDALFAFCRATGAGWNVVRPSYIIGAVRDSALNHMVGLAIYGAVQAHRGLPLAFPGDYAAWDREYCQSTALLNAHLEEWAVLTDAAANEAFNVQDGTSFTWGRFWTYLARWFGTGWTPPEADETKYHTTASRHTQPPRGYGPQGVTRSTFSLLEWSGEPAVQAAWAELKAKHALALDPFTERNRPQIFSMTDSAVIGGWALSLSMRKARKLGFHGSVDSYETAFNTMRDLARLKVVPPPVATQFEN
ncbi:NAD(P)-binding domain protein [Niveomyces insectorum RCEF 264]|uniref:NAD(P)-binding domain protein n=1 Tax=Niveomyces insectorum RCEF 264 TaxID=1081102 RepID=A0A167XTH1_9HYPO|nr:NAD(P)-binding domain protein [Niveomyces insectorum RCEF 264]